jgi:uncharacterized protein GlcG (DUF336 family)
VFYKKIAWLLLGSVVLLCSLPGPAQKADSNDPIDQMHVAYGISINLADAKKVVAAAVAHAQKQKWEMAIAVVDVSGELVYFERLDGTETAAVQMALGKAQTAVLYRRPTKAFEDRLAQGGANLRVLGMKGVVPVDGGVPLVVSGKIVGAIGISGGSSQEDGQTANAGAAALQ